MKVVYIAGPYNAENAWEIERNVRRAEVAALSIWAKGAAAVCPHTLTRFYAGALPERIWIEGLLALMLRCDAVLMMPSWRASPGAQREREEAIRCGIPVFYSDSDLRIWLQAQDRNRALDNGSGAK